MTLNLDILTGDILDVTADVLIATANPWLQMTGGVNLAILVRPRGELVHEELQRYLPTAGRRLVEPGTVVRTGPGSLPVRHILHAVAIDPSYDSSVSLVTATLGRALKMARTLGARVVSTPALATGYGPLSMADFAAVLQQVRERDWAPLETLKVVLLREEDAGTVRAILG